MHAEAKMANFLELPFDVSVSGDLKISNQPLIHRSAKNTLFYTTFFQKYDTQSLQPSSKTDQRILCFFSF